MPVSWQTIFLIIRYLCKHKAGIQELIGDISKIVCWRGGGQGCGRERASRAPVGVVHGGRAPGERGSRGFEYYGFRKRNPKYYSKIV